MLEVLVIIILIIIWKKEIYEIWIFYYLLGISWFFWRSFLMLGRNGMFEIEVEEIWKV